MGRVLFAPSSTKGNSNFIGTSFFFVFDVLIMVRGNFSVRDHKFITILWKIHANTNSRIFSESYRVSTKSPEPFWWCSFKSSRVERKCFSKSWILYITRWKFNQFIFGTFHWMVSCKWSQKLQKTTENIFLPLCEFFKRRIQALGNFASGSISVIFSQKSFSPYGIFALWSFPRKEF